MHKRILVNVVLLAVCVLVVGVLIREHRGVNTDSVYPTINVEDWDSTSLWKQDMSAFSIPASEYSAVNVKNWDSTLLRNQDFSAMFRVPLLTFDLDGCDLTLYSGKDNELYFQLGNNLSFDLIDAQYNSIKADEVYSLSLERVGDLQWTMYDSSNDVRYEIFKCGIDFTVYTIPDCEEE